jgi:PAS domain S-box-containing protein
MNRSSDSPGVVRRPRPIQRATLVLSALLLVLLLIAPPATAADDVSRVIDETQPPVNVLLLFASPRLTPAQIALDEAFRSTLTSRLSAPVYFYTEYLDLTLFQGDEPRPELRTLLRQKYRGVKLDLVVALASRALRFALQNRADLFPGAPVVFATVDRDTLGTLKLDADVAGLWLSIDWTGTLDAALALQPDTRRVLVITGTSAIDRVWQVAAKRQLGTGRYQGRVDIEYLTDRSVEQVLQRVATLSRGTIVLFGAFTRDATGQNLIAAEVVRRVAASSSVPVYGPGETYIGNGIVGGHVVSFYAQGVRAAELAVRVLGGERPQPTDGQTNVYMFDWRQLRRWGLDEARLPAGSEVRFRAPSPWDLYKWPVFGGVVLVTLQAALIVGLLVNRSQRRRAQQALAERLRFETLVSELSAAFVTVPAREVGSRIGKALQHIVEELRLDRAVLAELDGQRDEMIEVTHSWTRNGVGAVAGPLERKAFPWIGSRIRAGHVVAVARLDDLPDTAETDRRSLVARGTRSFVAVPLVIDGVAGGALVFSSLREEREWPDELTQRLRLLAEIFANALARRRAATAARESEDRFRLLADTAPLMIWMAEPDGRRTYFNRRWLDLTGRGPDEDLAGGWIDSVNPDDREVVGETYRQAVADRRSFTIDYRLRRRDGEDRWILDHGVPRIGEDGSFVGYVGSVIDITALNTALQAVLESNALRSAIFGSLYGQVAAIDRDGVIIAVNHSWTRFAEESADPARGLAVGANCLEIWRRPAGVRLPERDRRALVRDGRRAVPPPRGRRRDLVHRHHAPPQCGGRRATAARGPRARPARHHARRAGRLARARDQPAAGRHRDERPGGDPPARAPGCGAHGGLGGPERHRRRCSASVGDHPAASGAVAQGACAPGRPRPQRAGRRRRDPAPPRLRQEADHRATRPGSPRAHDRRGSGSAPAGDPEPPRQRERGDRPHRGRPARGRHRDQPPHAGSGRDRGARHRDRGEGVRAGPDVRAIREHEAGRARDGPGHQPIDRGGPRRADPGHRQSRSGTHPPRRAPLREDRRPAQRLAVRLSQSPSADRPAPIRPTTHWRGPRVRR